MAEREGFEPSIRFCRILTFQASAFDHSATAPHVPCPEGTRPSALCVRVQAIAYAGSVGQARTMIVALLAAAVVAQATPPAPPLPSDPIEADWRAIPDDELMVMTLAGGRTVVIRLAPAMAPEHVANVRRLALAHWWDGTSVYRVQDNWVTQWGDQTEKKPLPAGIVPRPAAASARPPPPARESPARALPPRLCHSYCAAEQNKSKRKWVKLRQAR